MITVEQRNSIYHVVTAPCGESWVGMTSTDDLAIQVRRALAHYPDCQGCAMVRESDAGADTTAQEDYQPRDPRDHTHGAEFEAYDAAERPDWWTPEYEAAALAGVAEAAEKFGDPGAPDTR